MKRKLDIEKVADMSVLRVKGRKAGRGDNGDGETLGASAGAVASSAPDDTAAAPLVPPFHSLVSFPIANGTYHCHATCLMENDNEVISAWIKKVKSSIARSSKHIDERFKAAIGLDCEWCPPWFRDNKPERINTVQLYSPFADSLIVSIGEGDRLSECIEELLADKSIAKVGVNVSGDGARLARDFRCCVHSLLNLEEGIGQRMTMESLCKKHCPSDFHINKDAIENKVRLGNWGAWPLTELQLKYASMDALLSYAIFLYQHNGRWEEREALVLPKIGDLKTHSCYPPKAGKEPELQRAPSSGGIHSNFFLMHQNRSIVPPNLNKKKHPRGAKDALKGLVIVVSGVLDSMSREDMTDYVKRHGGKIGKSVTKGTTHLVNDHGVIGPSKKDKCRNQGIPIVGEDEIFRIVESKSIDEAYP